jgi:hypothetical protein
VPLCLAAESGSDRLQPYRLEVLHSRSSRQGRRPGWIALARAEGQRRAHKPIKGWLAAGYLAEELEVRLQTIIAWRHGQRPPTLEQLERMRLDENEAP